MRSNNTFYGDLLGFPVRTIEEDPDKSFFFTGDVAIFVFPSRRPVPGDRFSEFRIGLDHISFTAPSIEALRELADRLIAAGVDTKGV